MFTLIPGVFSGLMNIVRQERFLALYKGNGAQMVRVFPYAATQFAAFEVYKQVSQLSQRAAGQPEVWVRIQVVTCISWCLSSRIMSVRLRFFLRRSSYSRVFKISVM